MQTIFVMVKCELGRAYEVADAAVQSVGQVSEVYSISGQYDLIMKFHLDQEVDIGRFVTTQVQTLPGVKDTFTLITSRPSPEAGPERRAVPAVGRILARERRHDGFYQLDCSAPAATSASTAAGPAPLRRELLVQRAAVAVLPYDPGPGPGRAGRAVPRRLPRPAGRALADGGGGRPRRAGRGAGGRRGARGARGDRAGGRAAGLRLPLPGEPGRHVRARRRVRGRGAAPRPGGMFGVAARGRGHPHPRRCPPNGVRMVAEGGSSPPTASSRCSGCS